MPQQERSVSADRGSPDASKEWSNVQDSEERRKIQNRVAQRKYRTSTGVPDFLQEISQIHRPLQYV